MPERYPGYDVLNKRDTLSWNEATRAVIDARLAIPDTPKFFDANEWQTLRAVCDRIVPQPDTRAPVPLAAMLDRKLADVEGEGYRVASLPPLREAWRRGLAALDAEAVAKDGRRFHELSAALAGAYYSHPVSWNEIGFGGPASPRGYVRMYFSRRDPWEAAEAKPGAEEQARRKNERVG